MTENIQKRLSSAVLALLRPLVRILLRNGVSYGSFAELAKDVYVDVAFTEFAPQAKKQTITRVSALTGLTRKDVKRLLEADEENGADSEQRYNRAVRVISGWVNDPEFQTAGGRPASLQIEGASGSFAELVRKYSGDVTTQSMLEVLESAASVARNADKVRLVRKAYVPSSDPVEKLDILGADTAELIATIDHNLTHGETALRYQRKVSNHQVAPEAISAFRKLSGERAQALLEELDAWLSENEATRDGEPSGTGRYVSLGVYFYEDSGKEEDAS